MFNHQQQQSQRIGQLGQPSVVDPLMQAMQTSGIPSAAKPNTMNNITFRGGGPTLPTPLVLPRNLPSNNSYLHGNSDCSTSYSRQSTHSQPPPPPRYPQQVAMQGMMQVTNFFWYQNQSQNPTYHQNGSPQDTQQQQHHQQQHQQQQQQQQPYSSISVHNQYSPAASPMSYLSQQSMISVPQPQYATLGVQGNGSSSANTRAPQMNSYSRTSFKSTDKSSCVPVQGTISVAGTVASSSSSSPSVACAAISTPPSASASMSASASTSASGSPPASTTMATTTPIVVGNNKSADSIMSTPNSTPHQEHPPSDLAESPFPTFTSRRNDPPTPERRRERDTSFNSGATSPNRRLSSVSMQTSQSAKMQQNLLAEQGRLVYHYSTLNMQLTSELEELRDVQYQQENEIEALKEKLEEEVRKRFSSRLSTASVSSTDNRDERLTDELERIRKERNEHEKVSNTVSKYNAKIMEEKKALKEELASCKSHLSELQSEKQQLQEDYSALKTTKEDCITDNVSSIKTLQQKLTDTLAEKQQLELSCSEKDQSLANYVSRIRHLEAEDAMKTIDCEASNQFRDQLKEMELDYDRYREKAEKDKQEFESRLEKEKKKWEEERTEMEIKWEGEKKEMDDKLDTLLKGEMRSKEEIDRSEESMTEMKKRFEDEKNTMKEEFEKEAASLRTQFEAEKQNMAEKHEQDQKEVDKQVMEKVKIALGAQEKKEKKSKQDNTRRMMELKIDMNKLRQENEKLKSASDSSDSDVQKLKDTINDLEAKKKATDDTLTELRSEVKELDTKLTEEKSKIQKLETEMKECGAVRSTLEEDKEILNARLMTEKAKLSISNYWISRCKKMEEEKKRDDDHLVIERKKFEAKISRLATEIAENESRHKSLRMTNCELSTRVVALEASLEAAQVNRDERRRQWVDVHKKEQRRLEWVKKEYASELEFSKNRETEGNENEHQTPNKKETADSNDNVKRRKLDMSFAQNAQTTEFDLIF